MRMLPSRYASRSKSAQLKKVVSQVKHLQAPLKGLSVNSKLVTTDAFTASVLDNFIIEKDRITVRPGLFKLAILSISGPISTIVPFYGSPQTLLLASGSRLFTSDGATVVRSGFTSDDWSWTSFSNLSTIDYTVMVNGHDGVWSWDGGTALVGAAVPVTSLSNANPAVVTVAAGDIAKFHDNQMVRIVGADTTHAAANGDHQITSVGTPANTFKLVGVDTSAATGAQTANVDVVPYGSVVKEAVTAPPAKPYIHPDNFHVVMAHMNRLWFAQPDTLALFYLPLQQKSGEVKEIPLNAVFRRGGSIVAVYTWTLDGGAGMDDQLVIFTDNGECVIYSGTDPDADFSLLGIFRFDSPMSKHSVLNYGGELYCLISTGFVPMSTMIRAEADKLAPADKNVADEFWPETRHKRGVFGFQAVLDYDSGWVICNLPSGAPNVYKQMVRFMPDPIWSSFSGIPSRCWQWLDSRLYVGSDDGILYEVSLDALNDDGRAITADVLLTWSNYNSAAIKHFKMVGMYLITDGVPRPYVDMRVDYDLSAPYNQPDVSTATVGAEWDLATWDVDYWDIHPKSRVLWNGVAEIGRVAAPRIKVSISNCRFSIAGFDLLYETGAAVG